MTEKMLAVYTGRYLNFKNQIDYKYEFFKDAGHAEERTVRYFSKKWKTTDRVGNVFEIEVEARDETGNLITVRGISYTGNWTHWEDVMRWEAEDKSVAERFTDHKNDTKQKNRSAYREALDPIRKAYMGASYHQRVFILAAVIEEITRP